MQGERGKKEQGESARSAERSEKSKERERGKRGCRERGIVQLMREECEKRGAKGRQKRREGEVSGGRRAKGRKVQGEGLNVEKKSIRESGERREEYRERGREEEYRKSGKY